MIIVEKVSSQSNIYRLSLCSHYHYYRHWQAFRLTWCEYVYHLFTLFTTGRANRFSFSWSTCSNRLWTLCSMYISNRFNRLAYHNACKISVSLWYLANWLAMWQPFPHSHLNFINIYAFNRFMISNFNGFAKMKRAAVGMLSFILNNVRHTVQKCHQQLSVHRTYRSNLVKMSRARRDI